MSEPGMGSRALHGTGSTHFDRLVAASARRQSAEAGLVYPPVGLRLKLACLDPQGEPICPTLLNGSTGYPCLKAKPHRRKHWFATPSDVDWSDLRVAVIVPIYESGGEIR